MNQKASWHQLEPALKQELVDYLAQYITPHKRQRMDEILQWRTRYITVALEDIYHPRNASAVIRSCECLGVQDIHVIEREKEFRPNRDIVVGAAKWISLREYKSDAQACFRHLKEQGYRIAATTLRQEAIPVQDLDLKQKVALCFGTEELGLSKEAHALADVFIKIPMVGFTQSFNVSVTAAICLFELTNRLRISTVPWQLSPAEKVDLKIEWMSGIARRGDLLIQKFMGNYYDNVKLT